ncbi:GNAT family N-acetyltransferase [Streptomyces sp. NPDC003077]|uniref:GNAT family N-acetyltransferase n=1 Tax=Streptomyces sp. NPDC003077 TaxID=3154443 RepID=UPI0033BBC664
MTTLEFRTIPEAHADRALDLHYLVFHDDAEEERRKAHRDILLHCDRIGAYDGDELVGLLGAHPLRLSVPGGELPCAGVTFVSVAPTHRRRGVLSGMIRELWRRCAAAEQPLAALWVSEAAIYGRFGFDPATRSYTIEIDSSRPLALRIEPDDRPLRLVPPQDAPAVIGALHEEHRARRAGRVGRDDFWWRTHILREKRDENEDLSPPRVVTIGGGRNGEPPAGYVLYRTLGSDDDNGTPGVVYVEELEADSPATAAALWRYVASIDLTDKVRAWGRPVDDPLLHFAADRDQVRVVQEFGALWLRLVDVPAALRARAWAAPADLVLDLTDAGVPANAGRYRLTVAHSGATISLTDDAPDLSLDVRELAACYLGGTELRHLVAAGLVTEHTPGAASALDAALRTRELPHTADEF